MKKILTVLITILMIFSLAGCGKKELTTQEKFNNVNVRKAMTYAIDRETLVKSLNDGSIAAGGIIPVDLTTNYITGEEYRSEVGTIVSYDAAKAQEYYAKACEELGVKEISIDLLYGSNEGDSVTKGAEQIAYYLEEAGFKVNLTPVQKKTRLANAAAGDFEVMFTRWGPDYADPQTYMDLFKSDNPDNNYGWYDSEEYDTLVAEAENTTDKATRWSKFVEAENLLVVEDAGIVPVLQSGKSSLTRPGVTGIQYHNAAVDDFRHVTGKDTVVLTTATDVISWDSCIATDGLSFGAQMEIQSGLFALDADGNPYNDMCEDYTVSEDGLTYTFTIKKDAKWSNGADVTADDFVFAWSRLLDEATASEYSWWMEDVIPAESFKAIDSKTLELKLSKASIPVEQSLAFPSTFPINEEFYNSCVKDGVNLYGTAPEYLLSNGPFILDSWTPDLSFEFSPNKAYVNAADFKDAPSKVVFRVVKEAATGLEAYQKGEVDLIDLSSELVNANQSDPGYGVRLQGYLWYLQININHVKG